MRTYDINTSDETVDGTPPGQTFSPLRLTPEDSPGDQVRVGLWTQLSTILGKYVFDTETDGLDVPLILSPQTSDAERVAEVSETVLRFPGVLGISQGPVVTKSADGSTATITVTALVDGGSVSLAVTVP